MRFASRLGSIVLSFAALACEAERVKDAGSAAPSAAATPSAAAWPELPRTPAAAAELIRTRTARDLAGLELAATSPEALLQAIAAAPAALVAGEPGVVAWIQGFLDRAASARRDGVVLYGSYHDAGGQIDAFRRLVGPLGLRGLTVVAVEQLRADGAWKGVPPELQRGDDAAIGAWLGGDRGALDALARRHAASDYAAWKFGYEPAVLDLLVTARAAGIRIAGCDLAASAQALLGDVPEGSRLRLREIHCLLSLPASAGPRRAALLWGQAHVRRDGIRRFLPPSTAALSIYAFGFRSGEGTTEAALGARLALTDPILVPLDPAGTEVALLYPDGPLAAAIDRVRSDTASKEAGLHVQLEGASGTLRVGDRVFPVGPEMRRLEAPPGDHAYVLDAGPLRFAGAIHLPAGGDLDLIFDPARRALALTEHPAP